MIIATAGHVDHGKTSLVKALTGADTDRLPEEKQRGLTIDLGFAYRPLDDGKVIGFVDVPGHERFVHTMVAGVGGVDAAMLVVAADDGVMPQTREHVAILDLLGVSRGLVVLAKIDLAGDARQDDVKREIGALLAKTRLAGAEIIPASSVTGAGIDALHGAIADLAGDQGARPAQGGFRMAIDRRFTIHGAGLVVTGTVFAGRAGLNDNLLVAPSRRAARVRGLHAQNRPAEAVRAGDRAAVNIAGTEIDRDRIGRGDWLVTLENFAATTRIDGRLRVLESETRPLKHWTPAHLHAGALDMPCRVATLTGSAIAPGEHGLVQVVTARPIAAWHHDRFVLRDQSARRTMAGGYVIDPAAPGRGRARAPRLQILEAMDTETAAQALAALLAIQTYGVDLERLRLAFNLTGREAGAIWPAVASRIIGPADQPIAIADRFWDDLLSRIEDLVRAWHERAPDRIGPSETDLAKALPGRTPMVLVGAALDHLLAAGTVSRRGNRVRLPGHRPRLKDADAARWADIRQGLETGGLKPPRIRELAEASALELDQVEAVLDRAGGLGLVVRATRNRVFLPETLRALAETAKALADDPERPFTTAAFRDATGIGRNLSVEVLEFFDQSGLTRRKGDVRIMRRAPEDVFGVG